MILRKIGPFGLLIIMASLLAIFTAPAALGLTVGDAGVSPQQGPTAVKITVLDCTGNPVHSAVIQLQSLTWGGWTYTDSNGNAFLSVPPGTYTLRGGYGSFTISQTINIGAEGATGTVSLGGGCASSTFNPSTGSSVTQQAIITDHTKPQH